MYNFDQENETWFKREPIGEKGVEGYKEWRAMAIGKYEEFLAKKEASMKRQA